MHKKISFLILIMLSFLSASHCQDRFIQNGGESKVDLLWHFNFGSGDTAYDSSNNLSTGTITGSLWVNGLMGKAMSLNGTSSDHIDRLGASIPLGSSSRTMMMWVHPINNDANMPAIGYGVDSIGQVFALRVNVNKLRFVGFGADFDGTADVLQDEWSLICVTYNGTTVKLYVNGEFDAESDETLDTAFDNAIGFTVGRNPYSSFQVVWFEGQVEEPVIYNEALTPAEIKSIYERQRP